MAHISSVLRFRHFTIQNKKKQKYRFVQFYLCKTLLRASNDFSFGIKFQYICFSLTIVSIVFLYSLQILWRNTRWFYVFFSFQKNLNVDSFCPFLSLSFPSLEKRNPQKQITVLHSKAFETKPSNYLTESLYPLRIDFVNAYNFFFLLFERDILCFWAPHLINLYIPFGDDFRIKFWCHFEMYPIQWGLLALNGSMCWQYMKSVRIHPQLMPSSWNRTQWCAAKEREKNRFLLG